MTGGITDEQLHRYVAGELSTAAAHNIERAAIASAELHQRIDELRREQALIEELRDSFKLRLPEQEEARILERGIQRLGTTLAGRNSEA